LRMACRPSGWAEEGGEGPVEGGDVRGEGGGALGRRPGEEHHLVPLAAGEVVGVRDGAERGACCQLATGGMKLTGDILGQEAREDVQPGDGRWIARSGDDHLLIIRGVEERVERPRALAPHRE
jgi:hypothetical protein